ncbi:ABC transporter permease [Alkalihalobacterium chitinilyticum]|uniref:ABC transporter permease n=1 Tax=Alkalihalobacterium chitinilyticum TaxID=2980103 RepID=A0ABT5VGJ4_9BACI|nr:ABC transporter permease [Alkalihalobacterium chitinilyticum]MDE5414561.1 ABC transporter permease [Alkalihalobacterium chitinilyticum]
MSFWVITRKDLKILLQDRGAVVVLFLLPIMFISIMSFALMPMYNLGGKDVEVLVVNDDSSEASFRFEETLNKVDGLTVVSKFEGQKLTEEQAQSLVLDGKYPLSIIIPSQFSQALSQQEPIAITTYQDAAQRSSTSVLEKAIEGVTQSFSMQYTINRMVDNQVEVVNEKLNDELAKMEEKYEQQYEQLLNSVSVGLFSLETIESSTIAGDIERDSLILDAMKDELKIEAQEALNNPNVTVHSLTGAQRRSSQPDPFQQNVPGYTVMFAFFIVTFAGRSFLNEKRSGTLQRILLAPVSGWNLLIGKWVPFYLIGLTQVAILFSFGHFVFGMSLGSSLFALLLISLALVWVSSSLGMLIASLVQTESQITGWSVMVILTMAALGGTMVPLFVMPDLMQQIAFITPHAWALTAYQDILVRELSWTDILNNLFILGGFGAVFMLISIWRMRTYISGEQDSTKQIITRNELVEKDS